LSEFIYAVRRIKERGLLCCAHYITDLPFDDLSDVIEGAKFLSSLGVDQVKCHSLYILENTVLGDMYLSGKISPVKYEEFIERTLCFLEYLDPGIVVQRLTGRAPEERTLFCNWGRSWRKIVDDIEDRMSLGNRYQGKCFNYLDAKEIDLCKKRPL
jgi:radical SAM superfamily enzyme